ncbi:MAG: twin-arginine translocation signal domain-containing protein, partial [Planctomycetota bacterium]
MTTTPDADSATGLSRRDFVRSTAAGAGAMLAMPALGQDEPAKVDDLNLAIIGPGSQGRNLLTKCLKIAGVRFKAVCDIWHYHQKYAANILKKFDQPVSV